VFKDYGAQSLVSEYHLDTERIWRGVQSELGRYPHASRLGAFDDMVRALKAEAIRDRILEAVAEEAAVDLNEAHRRRLWEQSGRDKEASLREAARRGDAPFAVVLLRMEADPNAKDMRGNTALAYARRHGHDELARLLKEAGAIETDDAQLLVRAVRAGDLVAARAVLDRVPAGEVPSGDRAALIAAVNGRHAEIVRMLLEAGVDPNHRCDEGVAAFFYAVGSGSPELIRVFLEHGIDPDAPNDDGYRPLYLAVDWGAVGAIRPLIEGGASVDLELESGTGAGWNPLSIAIVRGNREAVLALLEGGADMNRLVRQAPAIYHAAYQNQPELAALLLERGADPNGTYRTRGMTPLHAAALRGNVDTIEVFAMAEGVRLNARDREDNTPLHYAAYEGHIEAVRALLRHGADPQAKQRMGYTVAQAARHRGHEELALLIEEAGETELLIQVPLD
jgi:ankyrin repeat protein